MKILFNKFFLADKTECVFLRVDPENLLLTIQDILNELADLSWLTRIPSEPLKEAFKHHAQSTIEALADRFNDVTDDSSIKEECGEYIVSSLSKKAIVINQAHKDVPLMELLGKKRTGNPGFDFYTEKTTPQSLIFCGEAKYLANANAFNSSLKQISTFISTRKHVDDLTDIRDLVSQESQENLVDGKFGVSSGFSAICSYDDDSLINNISVNPHFIELVNKCGSIILVAVNLS